MLTFVRGGWVNPAGAEARSSLQYVEYALEDCNLVRRSRPYLDPTPDTPTTTAVLATDVDDVAAFVLLGGEWQPAARMAASATTSLPAAIAIEFKSAELGYIRQAFQLPAP
jgi:general secretion pathway protein J